MNSPKQAPTGLGDVKAIAFDIQGTCVDFYRPILRMGAQVNRTKNLDLDWATLSVEWREIYRQSLDAVIENRRSWIRVDQIYREALDLLLDRRELSSVFAASERDRINEVWTQLDPWPDSIAGLARLRRRFTLVTLSNAGMAAAIAIVKNASLPFDAVLTAELARSYKPSPAVYQLVTDYLTLRPEQILLVACHKYDLAAARKFGMRTAFVARPLEFGPDVASDTAPEPWFDAYVDSLVELADIMKG
jgi:2-haloacid dehalogenase